VKSFGSVANSMKGFAAVLAFAVSMPGIPQEPAGLETVIVRAHKRAEPLHDVPAAVSTLTAKDLSSAGINNIQGVAEHLPVFDLQQSNSAWSTSVRIRRVGNLGNIPTFEPAVALFVDGAFRSRSFLAGEFLDVERVEVLRGPQVTLYGKNASAGVIALYTKEPARELEIEGELSYGAIDVKDSASVMRTRLALSGSFSETVRASFAAGKSEHGHTLMNAWAGAQDGDDQNRATMRGQLMWSPSSALDVRLIAGYVEEDNDQGQSDIFLAPGAASTQVIEAIQQLGLATSCPDNVPRNRASCSLAANWLKLEAVDVTLLGEYRLDNGWKLTSVTAWDHYETLRSDDDVAQLFAPALFFHDSDVGRSVQEELRVTSADGERFGWLAGAFYYRNDYDRGRDGNRPMFGPNGELAMHPMWSSLIGVPLALPNQLGSLDSSLDTRYVALFAEAKWNLTSRFSIASGLRWQEEEKDASLNNSVSVPGASLISLSLAPTVTQAGEPINGSVSRRSDDVAWSVTPQLDVREDLMAYATVARGAKFGGFNVGFGNLPLAAREFGDESIRHLELGAKLDRERMRLSIAAFHTEYDDYQDATFASAQFTIGNVEHVVLKGFEIEGRALLHEQVTADFAISRADLRYDRNTAGMCYPGRTSDGSLPGSCNLSGEHPIDAPEWATHVGVEYVAPIKRGEYFVRLDWAWTDRYNTSFSADLGLVQDAYSDVGLRFGARLGESLELVLWGENLLDEEVSYIDAVLNFFNDASFQSYLGEARSYGATLRVRF
jgi:iron complex outermembrane recepter protein